MAGKLAAGDGNGPGPGAGNDDVAFPATKHSQVSAPAIAVSALSATRAVGAVASSGVDGIKTRVLALAGATRAA